MKNILILLSFFYSFSFAEIAIDGVCYTLNPNITPNSNTNCVVTPDPSNHIQGIYLIFDYKLDYSYNCDPYKHYRYSSVQISQTTSKACPPPPPVGPTVTGNVLLQNGTNLIDFDDNATMMILSDGTASTWDIDGNEIPNREYNGVTPSPLVFVDDGFTPNTNKKYYDITFNGLPVFVADKDSAGFHLTSLLPLNALQTLTMMAVTPKTVTKSGDDIQKIPAPTAQHPNAVSIDVTSMNFDNVDFSEYENTATSTPTPIPNSDIVVEKITPETQKKHPSISSGTVIAHSNMPWSEFIATTPTTVAIAKENSDGSVTQTVIQKSDIQNTVNNGTDLPFVTQTITPPSIQSDGTTAQTTTVVAQGSTSPITGTTTTTNPTTGSTTTVQNPITGTSTTATTTSPSGNGSVDLSGVTSRLDKISNQLTKVNDFNDGLKNAVVSGDVKNTIDTSKIQGLIDTFSTSWDNIKADFERVATLTDEAKNTINNGFTFNLAHGAVTQCPYTGDIDLIVRTVPIEIDLCKVFSSVRPVFYVLFNLAFQVLLFMFAFKSVLRLV